MMKPKNVKALEADIGKLVRRMQPLIEKAEALGIFTGDRELLECSNCGLKEDVLTTGQLITYRGDAVRPDSGLRFIEMDNDCFRCPFCQMVFKPAPEKN